MFEREGALIDLRRLAQREPVDYDVVEAYAMALTQFERHRDAAGVLARIVDAAPERSETRAKLGAAYATIGMFDDARVELQAVIDNAPANADRSKARDVLERVATGEETARLREQQVGVIRERVAAGTATEKHVLLLARRLIEDGVQRGVQGPIDEARDMLERGRTTHAETLELERPCREAAEQAYNDAYGLERAGDDAGAAAAYQRAIDTGDPEHAPTAAVNLGNLLARHDDVNGARAAYRVAIESVHTDASPKASRALGGWCFSCGRSGSVRLSSHA